MPSSKATEGWRARWASRREDRRQKRAWRRERRKGSIGSGDETVGALESGKYPGGSLGPAGKQQGGDYPGF
jgi:hypothetical protein